LIVIVVVVVIVDVVVEKLKVALRLIHKRSVFTEEVPGIMLEGVDSEDIG
jgi:hypothetical protein